VASRSALPLQETNAESSLASARTRSTARARAARVLVEAQVEDAALEPDAYVDRHDGAAREQDPRPGGRARVRGITSTDRSPPDRARVLEGRARGEQEPGCRARLAPLAVPPDERAEGQRAPGASSARIAGHAVVEVEGASWAWRARGRASSTAGAPAPVARRLEDRHLERRPVGAGTGTAAHVGPMVHVSPLARTTRDAGPNGIPPRRTSATTVPRRSAGTTSRSASFASASIEIGPPIPSGSSRPFPTITSARIAPGGSPSRRTSLRAPSERSQATMSAPSESWLEPPSGHSREATVRSTPSAPSRRRVKVAHADAERSSAPDSIRIESSGRTGRFDPGAARAAGQRPRGGAAGRREARRRRRPGVGRCQNPRRARLARASPAEARSRRRPRTRRGPRARGRGRGGQAHGDSIGPDRRRAGPGAGIVGRDGPAPSPRRPPSAPGLRAPPTPRVRSIR
jgi:hypothetical protein